ncbi:MAG: potassium channel family protein [Cellulomonadaceae bacterium]|nr:potassium channel family protein [Cellulomonadaceae bacterium]
MGFLARSQAQSARQGNSLLLAPLTKREMNLAAWERYTQIPLMIAAILFLITYAVPIIWPNISFFLANLDADIFTIVWAAFVIDYLMRLGLATNRWSFFKHNLIDFFSLLLPMLRPLRVLRVVAAITTLSRVGRASLRKQVMTYTAGMVSMITFVAALAATSAERGVPNSSIQSFGDGLWWAFVTLTTVGYGDMSPVTIVGRIVGVVLMLSGVLLLGVIAASLASWLVEHSGNANTAAHQRQAADISLAVAGISALEDNVSKLTSDVERLTNMLAAERATTATIGEGVLQ